MNFFFDSNLNLLKSWLILLFFKFKKSEAFLKLDGISNPYDILFEHKIFEEFRIISSDNDEIQALVTLVINENQDIVERLENPEDKLVGFLVGQVMKSSETKVNPGSVKEVLLKELFG